MNLETNEILIYSIYSWNKKSYKFLRQLELPNINKLYIKNIQEAHRLAKHIFYRKYKLVLGIADNNKNATKHKVETTFINKYGKNEIIKNGATEFKPNILIPISENLYYANYSTNGPCNRSAYLVMKSIVENKLNTKFAFVHINKNLSFEELEKDVKKWISIENNL